MNLGRNISTGIVVGVARSLLALGTLLTIFFNNSEVLFPSRNFQQHKQIPIFDKINFFNAFNENDVFLARVFAAVVLVSVIVGYLPQITSILHWWVSFSFFQVSPVINGGDQITAILTLLLIPICVLDRRINHWKAEKTIAGNDYVKITRNIFLFLISLQMSVLYFVTFAGKLFAPQWVDGTALYYWLSHNQFGLLDFWRPFIIPLFSLPLVSEIATWGTLLLELLLSLGIFAPKKWKYELFLLGILLHFSIAVLFGLFTFFLAMMGGLVLYLLVPKSENKE